MQTKGKKLKTKKAKKVVKQEQNFGFQINLEEEEPDIITGDAKNDQEDGFRIIQSVHTKSEKEEQLVIIESSSECIQKENLELEQSTNLNHDENNLQQFLGQHVMQISEKNSNLHQEEVKQIKSVLQISPKLYSSHFPENISNQVIENNPQPITILQEQDQKLNEKKEKQIKSEILSNNLVTQELQQFNFSQKMSIVSKNEAVGKSKITKKKKTQSKAAPSSSISSILLSSVIMQDQIDAKQFASPTIQAGENIIQDFRKGQTPHQNKQSNIVNQDTSIQKSFTIQILDSYALSHSSIRDTQSLQFKRNQEEMKQQSLVEDIKIQQVEASNIKEVQQEVYRGNEGEQKNVEVLENLQQFTPIISFQKGIATSKKAKKGKISKKDSKAKQGQNLQNDFVQESFFEEPIEQPDIVLRSAIQQSIDSHVEKIPQIYQLVQQQNPTEIKQQANIVLSQQSIIKQQYISNAFEDQQKGIKDQHLSEQSQKQQYIEHHQTVQQSKDTVECNVVEFSMKQKEEQFLSEQTHILSFADPIKKIGKKQAKKEKSKKTNKKQQQSLFQFKNEKQQAAEQNGSNIVCQQETTLIQEVINQTLQKEQPNDINNLNWLQKDNQENSTANLTQQTLQRVQLSNIEIKQSQGEPVYIEQPHFQEASQNENKIQIQQIQQQKNQQNTESKVQDQQIQLIENVQLSFEPAYKKKEISKKGTRARSKLNQIKKKSNNLQISTINQQLKSSKDLDVGVVLPENSQPIKQQQFIGHEQNEGQIKNNQLSKVDVQENEVASLGHPSINLFQDNKREQQNVLLKKVDQKIVVVESKLEEKNIGSSEKLVQTLEKQQINNKEPQRKQQTSQFFEHDDRQISFENLRQKTKKTNITKKSNKKNTEKIKGKQKNAIRINFENTIEDSFQVKSQQQQNLEMKIPNLESNILDLQKKEGLTAIQVQQEQKKQDKQVVALNIQDRCNQSNHIIQSLLITPILSTHPVPLSNVQNMSSKTVKQDKPVVKRQIVNELVNLIRFHNDEQIRVMRERMKMLEQDIRSRLARNKGLTLKCKSNSIEQINPNTSFFKGIVQENIKLNHEFRLLNSNQN